MKDSKIEKLIEEKVQQRLEEEREEIREEVKQDIREEKEIKSSEEDEDISRRSFLKKLGAGAVGLGALGLTPVASSLKLTKDGVYGSNGLDFLDSGNKYFQVADGGPVEVKNTAFKLNGQPIRMSSGSYPYIDYNGADRLTITTDNTGSGQIAIDDAANGVNLMMFNEGGPVAVKNSHLQVVGGYNIQFPDSGSNNFQFVHNPSGPNLAIYDDVNNQNIMKYNAGGPIQVKNANLTVKGNTVWHAGNDGSGSGLDADTVDGKEASDLGGLAVGDFQKLSATAYSNSGTATATITPTTKFSGSNLIANVEMSASGLFPDTTQSIIMKDKVTYSTDGGGNVTKIYGQGILDESGKTANVSVTLKAFGIKY